MCVYLVFQFNWISINKLRFISIRLRSLSPSLYSAGLPASFSVARMIFAFSLVIILSVLVCLYSGLFFFILTEWDYIFMPALCFWLRAKLPQFAQVYEALSWQIFSEILFVREIEFLFVIIFASAEASTKIREYQVKRRILSASSSLIVTELKL